MPNKYMDTGLFDKAAKFAIDAHSNSERRGKGFPYVIHAMEAAEIVASITNDQELLAAAAASLCLGIKPEIMKECLDFDDADKLNGVAALLHDVIEDTDVTEEEIRAEFGDRIADLVTVESDPVYEGLSVYESWKMRKQYAIDRLSKQNREAKIISLGDKLSNMRAIARDFNKQGDELWKIFHAPDPRLHEWHYRELAKALEELSDTDAYQELIHLIDDTFSRAFKNLD